MADLLPEDIVINILLRLPLAVCIGRFRCVCRAWRDLLSDPNFFRQILFFQNSNDRENLRVLITGKGPHQPWPLHYSLRSYETLRPLSGYDSPSVLTPVSGHVSKVVGCCDGIFCISYTIFQERTVGRTTSDIILWNPTTSETKILPPCPLDPVYAVNYGLRWSRNEERIGFGFDPRTNDYKVILVLELEQSDAYLEEEEDIDDNALISSGCNSPIVFTEVYSLRNDSWKTLDRRSNNNNDPHIYVKGRYGDEAIYVHQQRDASRNEKCYWFREHGRKVYTIISFDMTSEEFGLVHVPGTTRGLKDDWEPISCFLSKGAFMTTFMANVDYKCDAGITCEIWGLLKYGVADSWTKLFAFRPSDELLFTQLEMWKDGMYICADQNYPGDVDTDKVYSFDPATGEIIHDNLQIEGTMLLFHAHTFTPTQLSLSLAG